MCVRVFLVFFVIKIDSYRVTPYVCCIEQLELQVNEKEELQLRCCFLQKKKATEFSTSSKW